MGGWGWGLHMHGWGGGGAACAWVHVGGAGRGCHIKASIGCSFALFTAHVLYNVQ